MVYQGTNLAIDPSPIKYKSVLKKKDFNKVILDSTSAFYTNKMACPKFSGIVGLEGLLWVEETFCKITKKIKWIDNGPKLFNNFAMVVEEGAVDHWDAIIEGVDQTKAHFNECTNQFYIIYRAQRTQEIPCISTLL